MSKEQKHKEDLEAAKGWFAIANKDNNTMAIQILENLFPELRESEDDRIRKELIEFIRHGNCVFDSLEQKNRFWAWLEKQGDQKSADKVESKFKVGDWVVYNRDDSSREIIQVYDIRDGRYYFTDNIHLSWSVKECDEKCHLWTIQDAKDGDALQANKFTLIFDSLAKDVDGNTVISSWYFCDNKKFYGMGTSKPDLWDIEEITPATKEQCDFLFQKMKEAGYEWDAEKKELKKIEQKHVDVSIKEKAHQIAWEMSKHYDPLLSKESWCEMAALDMASWLEKQGEQKPTPKFKIGDTIHKIGENTVFPMTIEKIEDGDYVCNNSHSFVNIKFQDYYELVEQKPSWSEEDEEKLNTIIEVLGDNSLLVQWFKSLKDSVQPQSKQEWSEEDEKMLNKIIDELTPYGECPDYPSPEEQEYYYTRQEMIDWLKAIKHKKHWKPSEEQLGTLYNNLKNL